ncbi:MAG: hypothetical protein GEU73_14845 [Chloroflexi bacterium]|nr:hypothetical protein [Chloroflexota bacterium]
MIVLFEELERDFRSTVDAGTLGEAFVGWRSNHSALHRYSDAQALIADFRDETVSYESTEDPLFALCGLVQEDDDLAISLVLELYMPSLRKMVGENRARSPLALEELESAAVEGFLTAVRNLSPGQHKPHRALTRGAERRVLAAVRAAREPRTQPYAEVPETASARGAEEEWFAHIELAGDPKELIDEAERTGLISNFDARLIEVTQLGDVSLDGFARWVGKSYGAVRQRRSRAEKKLVTWLWTKARLPGKPPPRRM